jgi:ATP-dependent Zn protease
VVWSAFIEDLLEKVMERKDINEVDDPTIILADMAEKAIRQVKATVNGLLRERMGVERAEQIVYSSVTTGAENDLKQVTEIARAMVTRWGMRLTRFHGSSPWSP